MTCGVKTCGRDVYQNGYCVAHNGRLKRLGNVMADVPIRKKAAKGEPLAWIRDHVGYDGDSCLSWPFSHDDKGYATIVWDGQSTTASRVMCIEAHGAPPTAQHESAHSCGSGHEGCVNPKHLRWATKKENGEDKSDHGRSIRGERSHLAILNEAQVKEVRRRLSAGERQVDIAEDIGVSHQLISAINTGHCWAWLNEGEAA